MDEWEQEARKKNDCVSEGLLLAKYKGLVFVDPDTGKTCSMHDKNMEFCRGRGNGWFVLAVSAEQEQNTDNDNAEYDSFSLEVACEVIGDTPQSDGIIVIRQEGS